MPSSDAILDKAAGAAKAVGKGAGWSALGLFAGQLVGTVIPHLGIDAATLGHMGSVLFLGLQQVGVFNRITFDKFKTDRARILEHKLTDIDRLYAQGTIDSAERTRLRNSALKEYGASGLTKKKGTGGE